MRSFLFSAVFGLATLGLFANPGAAQAWHHREYRASSYYYPAYAYPVPRAYYYSAPVSRYYSPYVTTYYYSAPAYGYSSGPVYRSYYAPGYTSYHYAPSRVVIYP